jgi:hypothetical protein
MRLLAGAAAGTVSGGFGTMLIALVAGPGPWWQGYVSETGTGGQPYAVAYRWGLLLLALGVALLARVLCRGVCRLAALCLGVAAGMAATSAVVPCSHLCPLPPYEPTTLADVVHTAASILGMFLLAAAMAATWLAGGRAVLRRLAAGATVLTVPLGAALGLTMLLVGRGTLGATLERLLLMVAAGWLIGTALVAASGYAASWQRGGGRPGDGG